MTVELGHPWLSLIKGPVSQVLHMRVLVNCKCEMTQFAAFNKEFCCEQRTILQSSRDVQQPFMRASHQPQGRIESTQNSLRAYQKFSERKNCKNNLIVVAVSSIFRTFFGIRVDLCLTNDSLFQCQRGNQEILFCFCKLCRIHIDSSFLSYQS